MQVNSQTKKRLTPISTIRIPNFSHDSSILSQRFESTNQKTGRPKFIMKTISALQQKNKGHYKIPTQTIHNSGEILPKYHTIRIKFDPQTGWHWITPEKKYLRPKVFRGREKKLSQPTGSSNRFLSLRLTFELFSIGVDWLVGWFWTVGGLVYVYCWKKSG